MNDQHATVLHEAAPDELATAKRLHDEILTRSATDLSFRRGLLTDPKKAINEHLREMHGTELTEWNHDVRFVEPVGDLTYVLPAQLDSEVALSEDDLETVAGGATPLLYFAGVATGMAIYAGVTAIDRWVGGEAS